MKKFIAILVGTLSVLGGAVGVALAAPGDNGHNTHGLCTAYFNGSENGRAHKRNAPPFVALEDTAEKWTQTTDTNGDGTMNADDAQEGADAVASYCSDTGINPKGIGGNPTPPGDSSSSSSTASNGKGKNK